jgi:hypothetical protein
MQTQACLLLENTQSCVRIWTKEFLIRGAEWWITQVAAAGAP